MCDIFPEIDKCFCIGYRIAMLYISVCGVMTGVFLLAVVQRETNSSMATVKNITNVAQIKSAKDVADQMHSQIPTVLSLIGMLFVIGGILLLFGNVSGQEGLVQVFVWLTFLAVIVGFLVVLAIGFDCINNSSKCFLSKMDWLTGAAALTFTIFYLIVWIYFISIANTFVTSM